MKKQITRYGVMIKMIKRKDEDVYFVARDSSITKKPEHAEKFENRIAAGLLTILVINKLPEIIPEEFLFDDEILNFEVQVCKFK
jgi:hypothetical protein